MAHPIENTLSKLKDQEITLLEMDNTLQSLTQSDNYRNSIFHYSEFDLFGHTTTDDRLDGEEASFSYKLNDDQEINVVFVLVKNNGMQFDTIVKITDWEVI